MSRLALVVKVLLTVIGLISTLAGILLAVCAYARTWRDFKQVPMFHEVVDMMRQVRRLVQRIQFWKKPKAVTAHVSANLSCLRAHLKGRVIMPPPTVPEDASVEDAIMLLAVGIDHLAANAIGDRDENRESVRQLETKLMEVTEKLRDADTQHRETAVTLATSTVRLQVLGLGLVGIGSVLLSLPTLFSL